MAAPVLRVGVIGLGRAFALMVPTFAGDPRVRLVAAADPRPEACRRFEQDFGGTADSSVERVCARPDVDVVYVASPHALHAEHALLAAAYGKHLLVEKPMATSLAQCRAMIDAARDAGVHLVVGHSHSFDAPILRARALIRQGTLGRVRMLHSMNFTDFLYRLRRPEELDPASGGGAVLNQAAHQVDVVRLLAGGCVTGVRALTGNWDAARPTEGAYAALLTFEGGAFASISYSGYAHFDSDALLDGIGEMGQRKDPAAYGAARRRLAAAVGAAGGAAGAQALAELALKQQRNYGGPGYSPETGPPAAGEPPLAHQHFGHLVVCCEHGDLHPTPHGIWVYGDSERRFEALDPPTVPRVEVIDELHAAVFDGVAPLHDGRWAMATTEVCLAMLESARTGRDVAPAHQVAAP